MTPSMQAGQSVLQPEMLQPESKARSMGQGETREAGDLNVRGVFLFLRDSHCVMGKGCY